MARAAGQSLRMLGGYHRGEPFWFRGIDLMAAGAEDAGIRQDRFRGRGIFSVFPLRAVTGLAVHSGVFAGLFDFGFVRVASLASLMPCVDNWQSCDFGNRVRTVVTVFAEA